MLMDWQVLAGDDAGAEPEPEPAPLMEKVVSAAEARQALERASGFRKAARAVGFQEERQQEIEDEQTWQQQKQTARQSWREEAEAVDAVCVETYKAVAFAQAVSVGQSRGTDWHGHAVAIAKGTKVKVLSMEDAQWWKVLVISADSAERKKGFVPASCLRLVEPKAKKKPQRPASSTASSSSEPQSGGGGGAACDAQREPARRMQRRLYGRKKVQPLRRA